MRPVGSRALPGIATKSRNAPSENRKAEPSGSGRPRIHRPRRGILRCRRREERHDAAPNTSSTFRNRTRPPGHKKCEDVLRPVRRRAGVCVAEARLIEFLRKRRAGRDRGKARRGARTGQSQFGIPSVAANSDGGVRCAPPLRAFIDCSDWHVRRDARRLTGKRKAGVAPREMALRQAEYWFLRTVLTPQDNVSVLGTWTRGHRPTCTLSVSGLTVKPAGRARRDWQRPQCGHTMKRPPESQPNQWPTISAVAPGIVVQAA